MWEGGSAGVPGWAGLLSALPSQGPQAANQKGAGGPPLRRPTRAAQRGPAGGGGLCPGSGGLPARALTPALSKTKPVVCACVEGVSLCPALGPCHCLHELFVWLDSPLFKREKFLLRSY